MRDIHVLVIDDSAFMRKMLSEMINSTPGLKVIDTARNGNDGIEKIKKLQPDVVTLDVEMPVLDGLSALKKIMEEVPVPVIMVSSLTTKGAASTIHAIELGAVDFISKPSGSISLDIEQIKSELVNKIKAAETANISQKNLKAPKQVDDEKHKNVIQPTISIHKHSIIAIGVSTGGPKALQEVITKLPANLDAPILIVQHMPAKFTQSLANRLNQLSELTVKEASHGEILQKGTAYIAPGDFHMKVEKIAATLVISLDQSEPYKGFRPSVNVLFESVARIRNINKVGIVLTGMGTDGTEGAKLMKKIDPNCLLIAESKQSAIIYGMPKSIIENVGADMIVPIEEMADVIVKTIN